MVKFSFVDGQSLCVYDGEKVRKFNCGFIERYKHNSENMQRASEWKRSGEGAIFRGDANVYDKGEPTFDCSVGGVYPMEQEDWVAYSCTVNGTSGIYKKCLSDDKTPETHVINSNNLSFGGGVLNIYNNSLAISVQRGHYNSDIAIFDLNTDDYKCVTDGDTLDVDPYISPEDCNVLYFSSRGVGRDSHGNFIELAPAVICRFDMNAMQIDEVAHSRNYSYFKPVYHGGKLYAIKAPVKEKRGNPVLEFLLFPWRILKAIAIAINIFVTATTGKGLTEGGANPAKGRDYDSRKIEIAGNLIDVEKQTRKNASKRDTDFGFIPKSWQLVEVESGKVIKSGIGDYDIAEDGTIIATNGKRIFAIKDGKSQKLCNTEFCIKVNCKHGTDKRSDSLFGF